MTKIDPRIHLAILLATSVASMFTTHYWQVDLLMLISAVYLLSSRIVKATVSCGLFYVCSELIVLFAPYKLGTILLLFYVLSRMMPAMMCAVVLLLNPPGRLMCAFERMHTPKPIQIIICILSRFFSVLLMEMRFIKAGIAARHIFPRRFDVLLHPVMAYECLFLPLIIRCLKISSELSASAELRGIECGNRRTSIYPVGIGFSGALAFGTYALMIAAVYLGGHFYGRAQ